MKDENVALRSSYWLTRIIFLKSLSFLYFIAFLIAFEQNTALIGPQGLTPAVNYLHNLRRQPQFQYQSLHQIFFQIPTVFWYISPTNDMLNGVSMIGMLISGFIFLKGASNSILLFLLWSLYMSLVNIGQTWYSFGWESLLLEMGFLSIFIVPLLKISSLPFLFNFPIIPMIGYRWLIFRVMFGAGLIKIRGDPCWVTPELSCMFFHYETQPIPNPLAPYLHILPQSFHRFEVLVNHFVELLCPFLLLIPFQRHCRLIGALIQIFFQILLICSGNLSFLNWLTILPCLTMLDDSFLLSCSLPFSQTTISLVNYLNSLSPTPLTSLRSLFKHHTSSSLTSSSPSSIFPTLSCLTRYFTHFLLLCLLSYFSFPVICNLLSSQQIMNTSYDPFRILNSYGAFGSITKTRHEVILQGTFQDPYSSSSSPVPMSPLWIDFEFRCKPGDINRSPCILTPYHLRLDWLMWFASHYSAYPSVPWLVHLSVKLLRKDEQILRLLDKAKNDEMDASLQMKYRERYIKLLSLQSPPSVCETTTPQAEGFDSCNAVAAASSVPMIPRHNVTHIRAQLYEYQYATNRLLKDNGGGWEEGSWWRRRKVRSFMPPISLSDPSVAQFLAHYGWSLSGQEQGRGGEMNN